MPESFDILTAIKSTYPSIQKDFRRSYPRAKPEEIDGLIGRFFYDTLLHPEKNSDPQARDKFLNSLSQSPNIPDDWKADQLTFIKNVTQEAFRFTPKATYAQQRGEGRLEKTFRESKEQAPQEYEFVEGMRYRPVPVGGKYEKGKVRPEVGGMALALIGVQETLRNVFGKWAVAPLAAGAAQVGVPGAESVAIAATPRVDFQTEIAKKYGPWAAIPYTIAEAGIGFIIPGVGYSRAIGLASRLPGAVGRLAKFTLIHPTFYNATFLGGYSGFDYMYQKRQAGEKPTIGEALVHIGAGTAIGTFMPHAQKILKNAAVRKEFGENMEMLLGKKMSQLKRMPESKLRKLIRESHLPKEVREPAGATQERLDWIAKQSKLPENLTVKRIRGFSNKGAAAQFLGQLTGALTVGAGVQVGTDVALGMPINLPNIAHHAATMAGFYLSGFARYVPKAVRPKDGIADLSTPQGKGIVGKSIKFLLSTPDMSPEQFQAKFVENLTKNKVEFIRTTTGELLNPREIFAELNKVTEPGSQSFFNHLALAYREYGKAMIMEPGAESLGGMGRLEMRTVMRSRIDNLIASVGRKLDVSTDVPSTAKPEVSSIKFNQDLYELKLKKIAEEFGQEGVDAVVESLRSEKPLPPEILNRHPEMKSVIENFRRATSEKVSAEEANQQIMDLRAQEEGGRKEAIPIIRTVDDLLKQGIKGKAIEIGKLVLVEKGQQPGTKEMLYDVFELDKPMMDADITGLEGKLTTYSTVTEKQLREHGIEIPVAEKSVAKAGTPTEEAFAKYMAEQEASKKPVTEKPSAEEKVAAKPKAAEKPLQPAWEPKADEFQRRSIDELRKRIPRPDNWKKLTDAYNSAKELFKGARGEMIPKEIAEAKRLLEIQREERASKRQPKDKTEPEELSQRVEELNDIIEEGSIRTAEEVYGDIGRLLNKAPLRDARTKEGKAVLARFGDVVAKLTRESKSFEIQDMLARQHYKVGDAVEHLGETGFVAKGLKDEQYVVYFPKEDAATPVHWTEAKPSTLKEAVKLGASLDRFRKAGEEAGMTRSEIDIFIDKVEGNGRLGIVVGVDPAELVKLAGKAASKVRELFRRKPSSINDLASSVELYRYRRYQRRHGSVLARFFQFAVFGDPMKEATKSQVRDIEKAIDQNETNPFMGAEPHLIDPTDFMVKVLDRTNWSRIMAKESGQPYKPMNRLDAQKLLKEFAKISVAIKDKNFWLASKVGLPLAISESTPRTRQAYESMTIATSKRDSRMADVYELVNSINVVADRKARKFINPNTGSNINREVSDILQGFVKPNDPNLMRESREIAGIFRQSRFREKFWDILNNVHNYRTLPKLRGSLTKDRNKFIEFWIERGLSSERVTPENSEATLKKLESEAGRIFDNPEKKKEIIDTIIEENKLGKIVSKEGMSLYYPGYMKKLTEVLREKAQKLEEGGYVRGGYGGIIFEHARKLTLEERKAHPELYKEPNVVDDFLTYGLNVLSLSYRADMDFHMWRATKQIKLDMEAAPKYAKRFAHDLEFIETLRDQILRPPRNIGRRISGNIAALTSAAILPGLRTVFRNLTGGTGMTYVWSGSKSMAAAWEAIRSGVYRGYSVPKIIKILGAEHQELIEGGIAKVKTKPTEVMPKGFSEEMSHWAATWTQYSLSRVMPLVPDVWPWFAQVTKRMTFAGSEGLLRPTAGMSGFISTYETVLAEGAKYRRNVRIFGNSVSELARIAKNKYGETISENFIQNRMKATKSPKAQNKFGLDLRVKETDKKLNQRAFREALKGARETIMWTQFLYGAINTPKLMAHPLGRVILVLRKYTWNKAMVGLRAMRELPPSKGGGSEEWARFMRYAGVVGISTALSKVLQINIGRYFADDFLEMLGSVKAMVDGVSPEEAFWGKSWKIWLAGAAVGRNMDILAHSQRDRAGLEMNKYLEVVLANSPYGKPIIDAWREYVKVTEYGKNVIEALANNLIGLTREYKR